LLNQSLEPKPHGRFSSASQLTSPARRGSVFGRSASTAPMNTPPPIIPQAPPPLVSAAPPASSFARQAALFSLLAPFVGIGINIVGSQPIRGNRIGMIVLGATCTLLILAGFVFGVVALLGTKKHGRKGIFGKAIAGICINGIIICFMLIAIPGFIKAAERAKEMQRQRMEQQQTQP